MALRQDPHLSLVGREPDEPETLGLAGLDVFLHLKNWTDVSLDCKGL